MQMFQKMPRKMPRKMPGKTPRKTSRKNDLQALGGCLPRDVTYFGRFASHFGLRLWTVSLSALIFPVNNVALATSKTPAVPAISSTPATSFGYSDLVGLIQTKHLNSIEALLPHLPTELRSGYTLMHKSRSMQAASEQYPRVILFGRDAQLTCAFNGDPRERGFNSLECIQFVGSERRFDFRQIVFPETGSISQDVVFSESGRTANGKVSCSVCHGQDPRPNWSGYASWPGAYGESDDGLGRELTAYSRFVASRANHPRYQYLIQDARANAPYIDHGADVRARPNLRFSELVGRYNARRTARLMQDRLPLWRSVAYSLRALKCALTNEQKALIERAGLDYLKDSNLTNIYQSLKIPSQQWTTRILKDLHGFQEFEHNSGFGLLSINTAMAFIDEIAAGRTPLKAKLKLTEALAKMKSYTDPHYQGEQSEFFQLLTRLLPDPDFYGTFRQNTAPICEELSEIFLPLYLKSRNERNETFESFRDQ